MLYTADANRVFTSTNDLSSAQYTLVKLDTSNANQVVQATANTDKILGVLMNNPKAGDSAAVRLRSAQGTYPVVAGGTINIGDYLTTTTGGKAITTTTSGDYLIGQAIVSAVANDIVEVMPLPSKF